MEGYLLAQVRLSLKFARAGAAGLAGNVFLGGLVRTGVYLKLDAADFVIAISDKP